MLLIDFNPRFYSQMAFEIDRGLPGLAELCGGVAFLETFAAEDEFEGVIDLVTRKAIRWDDKTLGMRATEEQELTGLDLSLHGERGYHLDEDVFGAVSDTAMPWGTIGWPCG